VRRTACWQSRTGKWLTTPKRATGIVNLRASATRRLKCGGLKWYWLASGYSESVGRALIVFVLLIALFTFGYTRVDFERSSKAAANSVAQMQPASTTSLSDTTGHPLELKDAAIYAAYVSIAET
jgi:hypothetical protein